MLAARGRMVLHDLYVVKEGQDLQASDAVEGTLHMRYTDAAGLHFVRPDGTISYLESGPTPWAAPLSNEAQVAQMRTLFASTGLSDNDITTLWSYLDPYQAIVFGSAALYASRGVSTMGGLPVGDIDLLVAPEAAARASIEGLLGSCGFSQLLTDERGYLDALHLVETCSNYAGEAVNPITFISVPHRNVGDDQTKPAIWFSRDNFINYQAASRWQNSQGTIVQIICLKSSFNDVYPGQTLVDFMANNADFTVAAGTFDGTVVNTPYPSDVNVTTYREEVRTYHVDWMIYRLQKWIARGFLIKFQSSTQVDSWNSIISQDWAQQESWITGLVTNEERQALVDSGCCPFPVA